MTFRDLDKQALKTNAYKILSKITLVDEGTIFTEDDKLVDWTYEDFRYVPETGFIGQFVERTLDGTFKDLENEIILQDKEINMQIGIINNIDDKTTWYDYGNFLITDVGDTDTTGNVTYQSCDYAKKFNKIYEDTITYPCTALQLAQNVCQQAGVEFGTEHFTNDDFVIENCQYDSDATLRDVIKDISKLAYSWVRIGNDNKCYIDFEQQNEEDVDIYDTLSTDEYYESKKQDLYFGPVNKIVIGMKDVEGENKVVLSDDYTEETECALYIYDNNLTYTPELRDLASKGCEKLFGLKYIPLEINSIGHPWLEGNELIKLTNTTDEVLYTYPFDRTIKYTGYITGTIASEAQTKTQSEYEFEGNLESAVKKTRIIVDKQNQEITALSQKIDSSVGQFQISNESSGRVVTTENAGNYLPVNLTFYGDSKQEGTPSPEFPSEIDVVDGIRNLIKTNNTYRNVLWAYEINNEEGNLVNQLNSLKSGYYNISLDWELTENTYNNHTVGSNDFTSVRLFNSVRTPQLNIKIPTTKLNDKQRVNMVFEIPQELVGNFTGMRLYGVGNNSVGSTGKATISNIQLNSGEYNYNYVPYGQNYLPLIIQSNNIKDEKIVNLPLGNNEFVKVGDIRDVCKIDFSTSQLVKEENIGKVILDDSYEWKLWNGKTYYTKINNLNDIDMNVVNAISDIFTYGGTISAYDENVIKNNYFCINGDSNKTNGNISFRNDNIESLEDWKLFVKENPIIVYYTLNTSTTKFVTIDEETFESLRLNQGHNELYIDDTLEPEMYLKYLTDSELNVQYAKTAELQLTNNQIRSEVSEKTTIYDRQFDQVNTSLDSKLSNDDLTPILSNYASTDSVTEVEKKVTEVQTSTNQYIGIVQNIQQNGVTQVRTETGFTFDKNGLNVTKSGAPTKTLLDENGMKVYSTTGSSQQEMQRTDSTGTYSENVTVRKYLVVGTHTRFEDYSGGTGAFFIG